MRSFRVFGRRDPTRAGEVDKAMAGDRTIGLRWRLVRSLFELLYRNRLLYWLASTIPFAGQWRTWQRLVLPRLRGKDVLEVGCGTGTLLADMAAAGYTCTAVDRSPAMLRATRARLRRLKMPLARATVRAADVRHLPFADASFDAVVSTFPTEYIYDPAAAREIARVLRPGGRLIVVLGAALLPARLALWPLVALQALVYGTALGSTPAAAEPLGGVQTGRLGALYAREGMAGRDEHVRGPFWLALLFLGEKSASGAPGGLIH